MSWAWEYDPSEEHVTAGAPPTPVVQVEEKAAELVRAAEALYVHGSAFEGTSLLGGTALVTDGMFVHQTVPRHERGYILQVTAW